MTIINQFKNYLDNQINNPMFEDGEAEREIPFVEYQDVKEDSIYLVAINGNKEYKFDYNPYFETVEGSCLYEFELVE